MCRRIITRQRQPITPRVSRVAGDRRAEPIRGGIEAHRKVQSHGKSVVCTSLKYHVYSATVSVRTLAAAHPIGQPLCLWTGGVTIAIFIVETRPTQLPPTHA